jgi:deoxyhypusine synthase
MVNNEQVARENILREGDEVSGTEVKGYDFNDGLDYSKILDNFSSSGAQATNFAKSVEIIKEMQSENAFIYLGYTSNMVSTGNREIIRWLIEHKKVNVCVTTAGAIEEDIIKCLEKFVIGDFRARGSELREKGINRIGNIFASNSGYCRFEDFFQPILEELYQEQIKTGKIHNPSEIIWKLGEKINDPKSICYWAWKNKIKIYCPAITDGALGDQIYFFKYKRPDFKVDVSEDIQGINDSTIGPKKTGVILVGAGVIKHHILNANMFRNGADYAVFINNASEHDASDAGALPEEAVSWGKLLPECKRVKIHGDATILFPLLVAKGFVE